PDDPRVGQQLGPILEHPEPVRAVALSPTGQTVLTGCMDARARLWSAATGQLIATSVRHEGNVVQVAYAPDGRTLLTASAGRAAGEGAKVFGRLWEAPPESVFTVLRTESNVGAAQLTWDG